MRRKVIVGSLAALVVAGGTAGAIAASGAKNEEHAVLADAAKRLGVGADELRNALSAAENAQLDAAVKAGRLTQAQANEIKRDRAQEGTVLGFGHHGGPRGPGGPGGPPFIADAARALGIDEAQLRERLRTGDAKARAAVEQAATKRLDADLKAGRITQEQHDEMLAHLDDVGRFHGRGGPGFGHP